MNLKKLLIGGLEFKWHYSQAMSKLDVHKLEQLRQSLAASGFELMFVCINTEQP